MFEGRWAWVGAIVGAAGVALRTYLKGRAMTDRSEVDPRLQRVRDVLWAHREAILDHVLLHTCELHTQAVDTIWLVGWDVDQFVLAALHDDRERLDG